MDYTCPRNNFALESDVNISVNRHELYIHVGKLSVMNFEILKSEKCKVRPQEGWLYRTARDQR